MLPKMMSRSRLVGKQLPASFGGVSGQFLPRAKIQTLYMCCWFFLSGPRAAIWPLWTNGCHLPRLGTLWAAFMLILGPCAKVAKPSIWFGRCASLVVIFAAIPQTVLALMGSSRALPSSLQLLNFEVQECCGESIQNLPLRLGSLAWKARSLEIWNAK